MRNSSAAKSAASSPPAPARISRMASFSSFGSFGRNSARSSASSARLRASSSGSSLFASAASSRSGSFASARASASARRASSWRRPASSSGRSSASSLPAFASSAGCRATAGSERRSSSARARARSSTILSVQSAMACSGGTGGAAKPRGSAPTPQVSDLKVKTPASKRWSAHAAGLPRRAARHPGRGEARDADHDGGRDRGAVLRPPALAPLPAASAVRDGARRARALRARLGARLPLGVSAGPALPVPGPAPGGRVALLARHRLALPALLRVLPAGPDARPAAGRGAGLGRVRLADRCGRDLERLPFAPRRTRRVLVPLRMARPRLRARRDGAARLRGGLARLGRRHPLRDARDQAALGGGPAAGVRAGVPRRPARLARGAGSELRAGRSARARSLSSVRHGNRAGAAARSRSSTGSGMGGPELALARGLNVVGVVSVPLPIPPRRMSARDAGFLYLEPSHTQLHIGCVAVVEGALRRDGLVARIEERLPRLRRYGQRAMSVPLSLGHPTWEDDPEFRTENHVYRWGLPAPGGEGELREAVARLLEEPLDRTRPLWEMHLIAGLAGGRSAVFQKVHHCMVDGLAGAQLLEALLDAEAAPARNAVPAQRAEAVLPVARERFARALGDEIRARARGTREAWRALSRPHAARAAVERLRSAAFSALQLASKDVVPLAVDPRDEAARFVATCDTTGRLKSNGAWTGIDALLELVDGLPAPVVAWVGQRLRLGRLANVIATNVPGPKETRWLRGAKVEELRPLVPISDGMGLGLAVFSYDGWLHIGLNADADLVPDLEKLERGLEEAFTALLGGGRT